MFERLLENIHPLYSLKSPSERADSETLRVGSPSPAREKTKILYV